MKIIKVFLFVMALVLALTAFTGCELLETECTHEGYETIRQSVIPTCTETGLSLGVYCSNCDAVIKEQEVTEARGHDKKISVGTTATCTEAGVETWYCAFCDSNYELEVEAYGHKLDEVAEKAPTCTEDGYTAHKACKNCDYTEGKEAVEATGHTLADVEGKAATCTEEGYTAYKACECGYTEGKEVLGTIEHNYTYGVCACGAKDPEYVDYYLIGWINGADYGCQADHANLGEYKFVDGKLTAQFTGDCYVFVKSGNLNGENVNWYLTETYVTGKEATLSVNKTEKMWIPGGVEVVFTLTVNEDGTLTLVADYHIHNFSAATCTEPKTCECGETEGEALGHKWVDGVCSVCGAESPKLYTAVMDNTITDTQSTLMTGNNDAELVGLDPTIFSVVGSKGSYGNNVTLYYKSTLAAPSQIRLYNHSSANGNAITVSVAEGYEIVSIKITFAITGRANGYVITDADGKEIANVATDATIENVEVVYDVNSGSFTFKNVHTGSSKQIWIDSIEITYTGK